MLMIPPAFLRFLQGLGPYSSLLILAIPLAIAEPLKLVAVWVFGEGRFVVAVLIMTCAYAASLFVTEQIFSIVKPKLLTLKWFAAVWRRFVQCRDETYRWILGRWTRGLQLLRAHR